MNYKINILTGGNSSEFYASVKSYENVLKDCNLKDSKIEIVNVFFITKDGVILHSDKKLPKKMEDLFVGGRFFSIYELPNELKKTNLYTFSLLMGNYGEDGSYQGFANMYDLRGSFGSIVNSAVSMDKYIMANIIKSINPEICYIDTLKIFKTTKLLDIIKFVENVKSDYFVIKPNNLGSSILTYKFKKDDLIHFLKKNKSIFKYDDEFLIQKYIKGQEYTVGVFRDLDKIKILSPMKLISKNNFLGYKEKHSSNNIKMLFSGIKNDLKNKLIKSAYDVFVKNNFTNFARIDFIESDNNLYFLEINTIPGLTEHSPFTQMLKKEKISINEMIYKLIVNSLKKSKMSTNFNEFVIKKYMNLE